MKPLREHLLDRDRAVQSQLDVVRRRVLAAELPLTVARPARAGFPPGLLATLRLLWRELVLPCRAAWAGLAAVWLVLLALHGATLRSSPESGAAGAPSEQALATAWASWHAQRRAWGELVAPASAVRFAPSAPPAVAPAVPRAMRLPAAAPAAGWA